MENCTANAKKVFYEQRVSVRRTLEQLEIGEVVYIPFNDTTPNSIRTQSRRLLPKRFQVTERGQVDKTKITRLQ